jgi:uncharacterized Zn finger protein
MNFPAFETQIERKILDRGFDYYENNNVIDVENLGNGEFSAVVEGSENYEVFVEISKGKVVEHSCDCPYDWGDVCKHVVAVLYYIRDTEILGESADKEGVKSQLQLIIDDMSEQDIRDYVLFYALRNRQFREDFTEEFG